MGAYWKKYGSALLRLKPVESVVTSTVSNGWYGNASDGTHSSISADSGWEGEYLKVVYVSSPSGINILAKKKGKYIYKTITGFLQIGEFEENELIANYTYSGTSVRDHVIAIALAKCTTPTGKIQDTDWMPYRIIPYGGYYNGFVVCTKGYSKIGIKTRVANDYQRIDVYTANDRTATEKSSGETLLGYANQTTETLIDVSDQDYVWLWTYNSSGGANKEGWYRLIT